jgi:phosphatidate phosphatase APP1
MLKTFLHRFLLTLENLIDSLRSEPEKRRMIEPYIGYATPDHRILRGRVLASLKRRKPDAEQSRWMNFRQMLGLFLTDEVAGVTVTSGGVQAVTDEEGYFTLLLPRDETVGWSSVPVEIKGHESSAACPIFVTGPEARYGVISDIDDTVLQTGAYSLLRNLWTSLTGNALTRKVFPDAIAFMQEMSEEGRNPVYYVSSSPWNLHHFLNRIFSLSGLVRGPKFLRDLGLSESQFITGTHGDHKGSSIDTILAADPDLRFVLVGDTGQHDAFVYRDAVERHPGRIAAVVLREPGPGPDAESLAAMHKIEAAGALLKHGTSFDGYAAAIKEALSGDTAERARTG